MPGAATTDFYSFNPTMAPLSGDLGPNVIQNLDDVEEEDEVAPVEDAACFANSPIVPKNFELSGDFGVVTEPAKVSVKNLLNH